MNDEQMIWESYKEFILTEEKIDIFSYDEIKHKFSDDEIFEKTNEIFNKAGIFLRPKQKRFPIGFVAMVGDEMVGVTQKVISETRFDDNQFWCDYGWWGEKRFHIEIVPDRYIGVPVKAYQFHIAVLPEYQGGTTGYLLIKANVDHAKELNEENPTVMYDHEIINPKLAHMLEKLFGFKYVIKDNPKSPRDGAGYQTTMMKFF